MESNLYFPPTSTIKNVTSWVTISSGAGQFIQFALISSFLLGRGTIRWENKPDVSHPSGGSACRMELVGSIDRTKQIAPRTSSRIWGSLNGQYKERRGHSIRALLSLVYSCLRELHNSLEACPPPIILGVHPLLLNRPNLYFLCNAVIPIRLIEFHLLCIVYSECRDRSGQQASNQRILLGPCTSFFKTNQLSIQTQIDS